MNIPVSNFPDLCLLTIFKHLPLFQLIRTISLVCRNWSRIQRDELKRRRTGGRKLILFQNCRQLKTLTKQESSKFSSKLIQFVQRDEDGSAWDRLATVDQLLLDALPVIGHALEERFTLSLMETLLNITHLTVIQRAIPMSCAVEPVLQLTRLIAHYETSLVSLKIDFLIHNQFNITQECQSNLNTSVLTLIGTINGLASLRHLSLSGTFENYNLKLRLTILSRLNSFACHRFYPTLMILASLKDNALEKQPQTIDYNDLLRLDQLVALTPELTFKFTRIGVLNHLTVDDFEDLEKLTDRFVSLICLELLIRSMPMTMMARCLSQLSELIHLRLTVSPIPQEEEGKPVQISKIRSVRLLHLNITTVSHLDTKRLHLAELFPNLQVLSLFQQTDRCDVCLYQRNYHHEDPNNSFEDQIEQCLSLARQPFKLCEKLRSIKLKTYEKVQGIRSRGLLSVDQL